MSAVELVVTDARVWAVGPATHWDVAPSVVLGGDGRLVVGESLTPPTQVSSAVQYVPAERIALMPRVPTVVESFAAVAGTVLSNLDVPVPVARVTLVCPTEWGGYRRAILAEALREFAAEVVFEDTAVRAVAADTEAARGRRAVVLEFGPTTTTASAVTPGPQGLELESCEFAPDLAGADLGVEPAATEALIALVGGLLAGRPVDAVRVLGLSDPAALAVVRAEIERLCGSDTSVRPVSGADLVRPAQPEPEYRPVPAPANEWLQPLRERAAAQRDPRQRRTAYLFGGIAAAVALAVVAFGVVFALGSGQNETEATVTPSAAPVEIAPPTTQPTPPALPPGTAPENFGRVRYRIPEGWKTAPANGDSRVDLAPVDGARQRITVTKTAVAPTAGYDQIATDLEAQMKQRPAMRDLRRDVVFGGRSMLAYTERPEGGSTVQWHVLVEHGTQVSIGCQYVGETWEALATTCDKFAASVHITP